MPIYEYECDVCRERFEKLVRSGDSKEIECPKCGSKKVHKAISLFGGLRASGSGGGYVPSGGSCGPT